MTSRGLTLFYAVATSVAGCLASSCERELGSQPKLAAPPAQVSSGIAGKLPDGLRAVPLAAVKSTQATKTLFERLDPKACGIDFTAQIDKTHPEARLYLVPMACGGIAAGDVTGDGRADIFCVGTTGPNNLYQQTTTADGALHFTDVTAQAGGDLDGGTSWGMGASMADIDNDGDLDVYVCNYDTRNQLFINDGRGHFTEEAAKYRLDFRTASHTAAFADYDNDGDLDLYLLTNRFVDPQGAKRKMEIQEVRNGRAILDADTERYYEPYFHTDEKAWYLRPVGQADLLLRNDGGRFVDASAKAGIKDLRGDGLSATWWDYDGDGWIDLYVANDFTAADLLLHNERDGTFKDIIADAVPHTSWASMGSDFGDLNGDGRFDFIVADMSATNHFKQKVNMGGMGGLILRRAVEAQPPQYMRNAVYINTGTPRFLEAGFLANLESSDWTWAVKIADLDCDGRLDVFFTNGMSRDVNDSDFAISADQLRNAPEWDFLKDLPIRAEKNLVFRNAGGPTGSKPTQLHFEDVSDAWGLGLVGASYGAAHADFDQDGDLDLAVMNIEEPIAVYRNNSSEGRRVLLRLIGTRSNRFGVGALVRAEIAGRPHVRQLVLQTGYLSSNEPVLHFALGAAEKVDRLQIRWPSGVEQTFEELPAGVFYTATEPPSQPAENAAARPTGERAARTPLFMPAPFSFRPHEEVGFDDFSLQPLLPHKLSQYGPGMAWGDVDCDGGDDLYLGGGAGQPGELRMNEGGGKFTAQWVDAFRDDKAREDMGALFFDSDSDGDLDLFVVSGSYEFPVNDERQRDRLYLNDGKGNFSHADGGVLPDLRDAGSCVAAADFDRDGDLDLFVGSRVIPGQYPVAPDSRLLRNDAGKFVEISAAAGLQKAGLVTGALWSDADGDGWVDLFVTLEWGPVKFFRNQSGHLEDQTAAARLDGLSGWWNSISGGDFDHDGDIDYVILNQGHNSKYHASAAHPVHIFYGDYFGQGEKQLVEAEFEKDTLFPVRGRSCSSRAMPALGEKFKSFRAFAAASVQEIYTPSALQKAEKWSATTLDSGVLINDGRATFSFRQLPQLAQISPGFGSGCADFDADGHVDIAIGQNFFGPQIETGNYDGGLGVLLRGRGDGTFDEVWPLESGLLLPGAVTAVCAADFDGDRRPDIIVAQNNGPVRGFLNQCRDGNSVGVRLEGGKGNLAAVGSRVTVTSADGKLQTQEIYAGSGYLSQNPPMLFFGLGASPAVARIDVRWPDGTVQTLRSPDLAGGSVAITRR
ncbi:MAG: FG-GAP-like repeat-containing protein [Verrucomicrobiales bacterium]